MPKLRCDALKCVYNCQRYCLKNVIHVNDDVDNKKCESFSERKYNDNDLKSEFATMGCTNQFVTIECKAKHCDYNCNGMCVSENVKIGTSDAKTKDETKCETFSL